ncbi:hypothetical protein [Enterobacter kobei]|uniref:Uncharacterized protein n=2 Tax=Enterobacter kobei TaxID=208224 RepID=A0ACC8S3L9_9ENTR|nr:hypothetical protein [Enterobacter kobei]OLR18102.1 hypothetical protein BH713_16510 [Enterobacter kobei]BCU54408.1 hypothetical protein ENKO_10020 [Enterobacter kobei]
MSCPDKGSMVSYNARNYRSRWEAKGEIPGVSPVWEPQGTCYVPVVPQLAVKETGINAVSY